MAVCGKLGEQPDRIRDECEHVREDQSIEGNALLGQCGRSIHARLDDHVVVLWFDGRANQLARPAAEVQDVESRVSWATCIEKGADLR